MGKRPTIRFIWDQITHVIPGAELARDLAIDACYIHVRLCCKDYDLRVCPYACPAAQGSQLGDLLAQLVVIKMLPENAWYARVRHDVLHSATTLASEKTHAGAGKVHDAVDAIFKQLHSLRSPGVRPL